MSTTRHLLLILLTASIVTACGTVQEKPQGHHGVPAATASTASVTPTGGEPLQKPASGSFSIPNVPASVIEAVPAHLAAVTSQSNLIPKSLALKDAEQSHVYSVMADSDITLAGAALVRATYTVLPGASTPQSSSSTDWLFIFHSASGQLGPQRQCPYVAGSSPNPCEEAHYAFMGVNAQSGKVDPALLGVS